MDQNLLNERNKLAINTYSYKMASPLYLKARLNHVNDITYTIDGDVDIFSDGRKNVVFYISVTYHYNCIDKIIEYKENGETEYKYFDLLFNGDECNITNIGDPIYFEELDEYQRTIDYKTTKTITITPEDGVIYDYRLEFPLLNDFMKFTSNQKSIISPIQDNLTVHNTINIGLLGTNTVVFSGYRYLFNNSTKIVTLELDIESYPKRDGSVYKIVPVIFDPKDSSKPITLEPIEGENKKSPTSGVYTITFNYDSEQYKLEERKLYKIKLQRYLYLAEDVKELNSDKIAEGLFISTPIFNGNYIGNKSFKNGITLKSGGYDYDIAKDDYISNFKDIKYLILNPIINISYNQHLENITKEVEGKTIYEQDESVSVGKQDIKETYKIETTFEPSLTLNNIELYPEELESGLIIDSNEISTQIYSRIIDGNEVLNTGTGKYEYYQDLVETKGGFQESQNSPVIKIQETVSEDYKTINTTVTVHSFIKGDLIETSLLCNRVITSLYDFIIKSYFNDDRSRYNISDPFVTVDFEGSNGLGIRFDSFPFIDHTYRDDAGTEIAATHSRYKQPLGILNDKIRQKTENLLLLEYNSNDYLAGCSPICHIDINTNGNELPTFKPGYKRIWMRISEKEYIPIFAINGLISDEDLSTIIFEDGDRLFKEVLYKIPHYYAYSEESRTIERKVIDYNRLMFTKEFDVTSNMKLNFSCYASLLNSTQEDYYYQINDLYNNRVNTNSVKVNTSVNIKQDNIKSNNSMQEELDVLDNLELDCVLEEPTHTASSNVSVFINPPELDFNRKIIYKDRKGNFFDPQYIYYLYECYNPSKGYQKSYKPNKFFISDLNCEFPELKDSSQLYCDSNGNPHPYVNPYLYKNKEKRKEDLRTLIGWTRVFQNSSYDISELDNTLTRQDSGYICFPIGITCNNNKLGYYNDCKFTMAQYEGSSITSTFFDPLVDYSVFNIKNIFDQYTIQSDKLHGWEGTESLNPMKDGWKSADEFLQQQTT